MEMTIHTQILLLVFGIAVIMGAVANKTNFCTMGAVSDWVNMGDTGRLRAWLLAIAVALLGVLALEAPAWSRCQPPPSRPTARRTSPGCATCSAASCSASA